VKAKITKNGIVAIQMLVTGYIPAFDGVYDVQETHISKQSKYRVRGIWFEENEVELLLQEDYPELYL